MMRGFQGEVRQWWPVRFLSGLVLVHNLSQAVPWLVAVVGAVATGAYGAAASSPTLLAVAAGVGTASVLTLLLNFLAWFLERRRRGYKQELGVKEILHGEAEEMAVALRLIRDLNLVPLKLVDPLRLYEETSEWLTKYLMPALWKVSPGVGVGLLQWKALDPTGEYRLAYDAGVPEIVRSVLPKQTNRHFTKCLAILKQKNHRHGALRDDHTQQVKDWLVAFPEAEFSKSAEAVFSTGARIVADAWRGIDEPAIAESV